MVSKASDDFPDPLNPVMTVNVLRGISTSMFFRLCCRAPCTVMRSNKTSIFPHRTNRTGGIGDSGRAPLAHACASAGPKRNRDRQGVGQGHRFLFKFAVHNFSVDSIWF